MFEIKVKTDTIFELSWKEDKDIYDQRDGYTTISRETREFSNELDARTFVEKQKRVKGCHDFQLIQKKWIPL